MRLACSFCLLIQITLLFAFAYTQQPEINDQYVTNAVSENTISTNNISGLETKTNKIEISENAQAKEIDVTATSSSQHETNAPTTPGIPENKTTKPRRAFSLSQPKPNCFVKIFEIISKGIDSFITIPKVNTVFKNIGVCIVNGIMEIITFYVPAPFIPLIASAAGMVIPFEPVVMLREKLPMKNYRRALDSAVNSFLGTFDRFAVHDEEDPYMTRRFNRRFMGNSNEELSTKRNGIDGD